MILSGVNSKIHGQALIKLSFPCENNDIKNKLNLEEKYNYLLTVCKFKTRVSKKYWDIRLCFYKNLTMFWR